MMTDQCLAHSANLNLSVVSRVTWGRRNRARAAWQAWTSLWHGLSSDVGTGGFYTQTGAFVSNLRLGGSAWRSKASVMQVTVDSVWAIPPRVKITQSATTPGQ